MNTRDNTFIDAYGLELNDELESAMTQPPRPETGTARQPTSGENTQPSERSYRFDAAARRSTLRGPHFNMQRVVPQVRDETPGWDALNMNVIDVGAAWAPTPDVLQPAPDVLQPALAAESASSMLSRAIEPLATREVAAAEATTESRADVTNSETPVEPQAEAAAVEAAETATRERADSENIESPAATNSLPSMEAVERFAPVWEVDRFHWPDDIEQLFKAQTEYFDYAGKKLVAASREGLSILAITSTRSGEGSTTLALCLARAAAGAGAKVGLLDGNLTRSELGAKLGVEFASGWQSAATRELPLAEAAITGLEEGITLFPSAAGPATEIASLADERVQQIFRTAAASYDLLIVDVGQADLGSSVKILDAAIVVRDIRHTSEAETLTAAAALRHGGVKAVGIAENFGSAKAIRAAA